MTASPAAIQASGAFGRAASPCDATVAVSAPNSASTAGYRHGIGWLQWRHAPSRTRNERSGTLSRAPMGSPHIGQAERPRTHESPRGSRYATTLRNDPRQHPTTAATATTNAGLTARAG